jgi:2,5-diketo-D-gluconate reductase B
MSVPTRVGGNSAGVDLPLIGLGTMRLRGDRCRDVVGAALAEGYRHVDTARKYGNEMEVGAALAASSVPRDAVVLVTKLASNELTTDRVRLATEDSLRNLRTDHLDLLLIHWPNPAVPLAETLDAMARLRDVGLVRGVGVANFPTRLLDAAADLVDDLVTDQVEYHPYLAQGAVLDRVRAHGMVLTAYCPLARQRLLADPVLIGVAEEHACTPAQVALRWLVQQADVVAIPGTSTVARLCENLAATEGPVLTQEQLAAIAGLARGDRVVDPPHAPTWDESSPG